MRLFFSTFCLTFYKNRVYLYRSRKMSKSHISKSFLHESQINLERAIRRVSELQAQQITQKMIKKLQSKGKRNDEFRSTEEN